MKVRIAQQHQLTEKEIYEYEEQTPSEALFWQFYQLKSNQYSLMKQLILFFRSKGFQIFLGRLIMIFLIQIVQLSAQLVMPFVIRQVLTYVQKEDKDLLDGLILIGIILMVKVISLLSANHLKLRMRLVGYDAMSILSMQIMNKCLRLSMLSNTQRTIGEITNLMQVDAQKIITAANNIMSIIIMPIQTSIEQVQFFLVITLTFIYQQIGISVLVGIAIIILTLVINNYLGKNLLQSQKQVLLSKDDRIKQTNEVFQQIKFIKINSYESIFQSKIEQLRELERKCIDKRLQYYSLNVFFGWLSPQIILSLSFGLYIYLGNQLTPAKVFPIISLLLMLAANLQLFPISINALLEISLSLKRLSVFFETHEIMDDCISKNTDKDYSIQIQNGNFSWNKDQLQNVKILNNVQLNIKKGAFISIIGDVGSGKSSLIQGLLGEMVYDESKENPKILICGNLAYVGQKAWIQNGTVRDNITFGKKFNQDLYDQVIYYSCLSQDLEILIDGDLTMIGEKGINLSGGQKARISLARAIYSGAQIILLDDPLSALDVHVGNFIMKECFLKHLSSKTRVLSTNALNFCQYTDYIYLIQNGKIIDEGNFGKISQSTKFQEIEQSNVLKTNQKTDVQQNQTQTTQSKIQSIQQNKNKAKTEDIILKEDRQIGKVDYEVYQKYFIYNGGLKNYVILILIMILWIISQLISNFWIAKWASDSNSHDHNSYVYLSVYFLLGIAQSLFAYARAASVVNSSLKSSSRIHNEIIQSLLKAPQCEFFERIPIGRIMNRLTKDINSLDIDININISLFSTKLSQIISATLLAIITSTKLIIAPFILFFYLSLKIKNIYMQASRELQRLELITKSPILSYFVESLQGLTIIRAYQKSNLFLTTFSQKLDQNRQISYVSTVANCWFTQVLGFSSLIVNMTAITYCIVIQNNASFIGLILTYVANLDQLIQQTIDTLSTLENNMISFERCLEFTKIPQEINTPTLKVEPDWPKQGLISFNNLSVKYRPDLPLALKNFSYKINNNEKIGIVGRTGAGKSTLALSLLRLLEAQEGQILIDNIDISQISLQILRNSITSIQQDSVIFNGSIRQNLDPFQQHDDDSIRQVLNDCCLTNLINQRNGLNTRINESGDNLSAGEKQLMCIARAILKRAKLVLIDEATANIDFETEQKIQKVISDQFSNCTVLIIAHRINTIMLCDKILVIDNGILVEEGSTQDLVNNPSSIFYNIYQEVIKNEVQ
ncbi:unnamed protein product [Paramecium pentaurelia]|uniref:Uncharacterized protein n=2 Tax=Paramecium pentaurelia TaxID=43138 RepID=A0A8S1WF09_9CILI|nr:unnamed protein product [Paramecium pentaurelia]